MDSYSPDVLDVQPPAPQQQPPVPATNGPQPPYPGSQAPLQPKPRRRGPFVALIVGVIVVLVLGLVLFWVEKNRTVACADSQCFTSRFAKCAPAAYTYTQGGSSVRYRVLGTADPGCTVEVQYLKSQYASDFTGKTMTCAFDNRLDFDTAAQNVFHYPADYDCKGNLAQLFQGSYSSGAQ